MSPRHALRLGLSSVAPFVAALLLASVDGCEMNCAPLGSVCDHYPDQARRQGLTGRVGLEYSVDAKGRRTDIVILESGGKLLDNAAKEVVSDRQIKIPPAPASAEPGRRYRVGVLFELRGMPVVAPFEDGRETVTLTGYPIPER
jgi:TonB family protein